jgi:hypothetical protein
MWLEERKKAAVKSHDDGYLNRSPPENFSLFIRRESFNSYIVERFIAILRVGYPLCTQCYGHPSLVACVSS